MEQEMTINDALKAFAIIAALFLLAARLETIFG